ncbi:MAG: hypothetical protein EKK62_16760 [Acidimicrobiia bacterium]|nr:MAG: hypothetical protein EKK62_16760 [Acidimicrobiia bacterium]
MRALDLRRDGLQWQQIADELGYHDDATAYRAVKRVLDRVESESATEYRAVMAARYEQLWRDARSSLDALPADHAGRAALLTSARGVLDSLARLHGITAAEVTVVTPEVRARDRIDEEIARLVTKLKTAAGPDVETPVLDGIVAEVEAMPDPAD